MMCKRLCDSEWMLLLPKAYVPDRWATARTLYELAPWFVSNLMLRYSHVPWSVMALLAIDLRATCTRI